MRSAFATLIVAAGLATAAQAQAQDPAAQAPAAAAPVQAAPAAPAAQAAPAAPATPGAPQAAAVGENITLPTSGIGATVLNVIEKVCVPIVRGQSLDTVAKAQGWKLNKREGSWSMPLGGEKAHQVIIFAQNSNKTVCQGEIRYPIGQDEELFKAVNVWSALHQPQLQMQANYVAVDPDGVKRVRRSWEYYDQRTSTAVNISTMKKPDDSPLGKNYDAAAIFYQERTF
ncbi:hypothetical protein [Phenylobacterium deserti]|uniref:Uncharacterized protein n=1 Tax=Phenylobacterium deserti TaxID=1914756 RepID=A0A328APX0_9CAUL|nr:hypothetical protein [Phenylobacterium deserti]RAK57040.1 hypothetical protein DJ018_03520 [Phenylobacterium deserti]